MNVLSAFQPYHSWNHPTGGQGPMRHGMHRAACWIIWHIYAGGGCTVGVCASAHGAWRAGGTPDGVRLGARELCRAVLVHSVTCVESAS